MNNCNYNNDNNNDYNDNNNHNNKYNHHDNHDNNNEDNDNYTDDSDNNNDDDNDNDNKNMVVIKRSCFKIKQICHVDISPSLTSTEVIYMCHTNKGEPYIFHGT